MKNFKVLSFCCLPYECFKKKEKPMIKTSVSWIALDVHIHYITYLFHIVVHIIQAKLPYIDKEDFESFTINILSPTRYYASYFYI
jgi:hypothetical protein